jgi:putative ABC transport system ATP-binding protein
MGEHSPHDSHGHDDGHGHRPARPYARLRLLLLPERRDVAAVVVFAVAVAVLSLATPIAVESLVNTVAFGILLWPVLVLAGLLMGCLGLAAVVRALQVYVVECLQRRLFVRVLADYADRLPRVKLAEFDRAHGPELINRFFDVLTVQKSLATLLLDGVAVIVTAVIGMVVLAFYHPFLLGFDVVLTALILFILLGLGWGGPSSALAESHVKYEVAGWLEELARCPKAFKSGGGPAHALAVADHLAADFLRAREAHFAVVWRQTVFALGLQVVASTALLGLGGYLVIDRQLSLGQLVAAELIVALVVASLSKLGKYAETYYDLLSGAEKLGLLTDLELDRAGGEVPAERDAGTAVRARGLRTMSGRPLPDWHAGPGERVAVTGPPGSGKTTLFEMVCGLRDPGGGVVELDGADVRALDLVRVRERAALVGEADLFAGTVLENVAVGRPGVGPAEVRAALDAVGLTDPVHDLPAGLNTPLSPTGAPLSATQRVALTLARGLAGRPRLLVLDGTLDALDLRACPALLDALFDPAAPWTLVVASADPEVLGRCGRVIDLGAAPVPLTPAEGH